jgi:hypothetical protein
LTRSGLKLHAGGRHAADTCGSPLFDFVEISELIVSSSKALVPMMQAAHFLNLNDSPSL